MSNLKDPKVNLNPGGWLDVDGVKVHEEDGELFAYVPHYTVISPTCHDRVVFEYDITRGWEYTFDACDLWADQWFSTLSDAVDAAFKRDTHGV